MSKRWLALFAVLAGVAGGCDNPASNTAGVKSVVAPRASATGTGVVLLAGSGATQTKSLVIGKNGAKINIGANALVVPRLAVDGPTNFVLTVKAQPYIAAEMTATDVATGKAVTTFKVDLTLTLSYANATTPIPDPSKLVVYWIQNGVVVQGQRTDVNVKGQKLTAYLNHFSEYSPGWDNATDSTPQ